MFSDPQEEKDSDVTPDLNITVVLSAWQRDVGGMRSPRGSGRSRGASGERPLRLGGELHPAGGAVPLRNHNHAGRTGPEASGRAGKPGAREERRCAAGRGLFVVLFVSLSRSGAHRGLFCRLDLDSLGRVSSRAAALPAAGQSEATGLPTVQKHRDMNLPVPFTVFFGV